MPMMQFSVAPWRILSKENVAICAKYAHLHQQMGDYILELAKHASKTGEPIVRHMEYQYPHRDSSIAKTSLCWGINIW